MSGNSYTYYNDLPTIVSKLAEAAGEAIEFDSHLEVRLFLNALASLKPVLSLTESVTNQTQIAEITIESISV